MNELKIFEKIKSLIKYANQYVLTSFPKVHTSLRISFQNNLYSLLENCIRANVNEGNIRGKYQKEMLINLHLLDFFLEEISTYKIIKANQYNAMIVRLNEIRKMTIGWSNIKREKGS